MSGQAENTSLLMCWLKLLILVNPDYLSLAQVSVSAFRRLRPRKSGRQTNQSIFSYERQLRTDPCEDQDCPAPLVGKETVAEEDDGAKDREELPGGGDDGAGQGAELRHAHEDEKLGETKVSPQL